MQADVLICNYHHIMDETIREQLYLNLQREPSDILLLIDEAHNCGDVMQDIMSVSLDHRALEQADHDIANIKKDIKDLEAIRRLIPGIKKFLDGLLRSTESEDWFDLDFQQDDPSRILCATMEEVVDDFMECQIISKSLTASVEISGRPELSTSPHFYTACITRGQTRHF